MVNKDSILKHRGIFGSENGTAEEILNSILDSLRSDKRTAEMAADCLSSIGPVTDAVIPALIQNLHHDERASRAMRYSLRSMGDVALQQLVAALPTAESPLRYYIIRTIGEFGPAARSASISLQSLLGAADPLDRFYAAWALTSIEGRKSDLTIEIARAYSGLGYSEIEIDIATDYLSDLGSDAADALPVIILGLMGLDDFLSSGPTDVLGKTGHRGIPAVPALLHQVSRLSSDQFEVVDERAANALESIAGDLRNRDELSEPLERAIGCRVSGSKQQSSCHLVAELTNAIRALEAWLDHPDLSMRLGAMAGLGFFGPAAIPALDHLCSFFSSDTPEERLHAAVACRQIGGDEKLYEEITALALDQSRVSAAMREWVQQVLFDKDS